MKVRNPLGSLRHLSAIAAAASPTLFSIVAGSLILATGNTASAQLKLPPTLAPQTSSPAAPAATAPAAPAAPQLMPSTSEQASQLMPPNPLRDRAVALTAEAKLAVVRGDLQTARGLIDQANSLRVPESAYAANQMRPWQVAMDLARAEMQRNPQLQNNMVQTAGGVIPAGGTGDPANVVQQGVYQPNVDMSKIQQAGAIQVGDNFGQPLPGSVDESASADSLYRQGVDALSAGDRAKAQQLFSAAWKKQAELDPQLRTQLKDKLTLLSQKPAEQAAADPMPVALQAASQEQALLRQKMFREVTTEIAESERMVNDQPVAALDRLKMLRQRVSQSAVEGGARKEYLAMVDRVITNVEGYIEQNKAAIDQQQRNTAIEGSIIADAANQARVSAEIQRLVDEYNMLTETQRYAEAEIVAKKVGQLDPQSEIAVVMVTKAKIARRNFDNEQVQSMKADGFLNGMHNVEMASVMTDDDIPLTMPDLRTWESITRNRIQKDDIQISPSERTIREKLNEPVAVSFQARPLSYAVDTISQMTGIPIILDPLGLNAEGLTSEQPVSLELNGNSISLKSALNLLLEPIGLTYVVRDEVLKITSASTVVRERKPRVYNVADLVIPIPNFANSNNSTLAGALQSAYQTQTGLVTVQNQNRTATQVAMEAGAAGANVNPNALGQMMPQGMNGGFGGISGGQSGPMPGGGMLGGGSNRGGGAAFADFATLIDLIQTTIPGEWDTQEDTIREFASNLSLIISAPLETHEQIAALLKQLRALQNLQVTVEIRFITLNDNFFERMGVDFDFNIDDNNGSRPGLSREDNGPSTAVGLSGSFSGAAPSLTSDLDIQFRQDSFGGTAPTFGGFSPAAGAQLGFAILSDLELYFFLNAAQGDTRTNVMQAPKLTMFDGQLANIFDGAQVPFVVGLNPIVGDFAVAQQPIVAIINNGTQLSVQSVVSQDKRFVRMTINPTFTNITDADRTFTFTGSRSSNTGSTVIGPNGDPLPTNDNQQQNFVGSTVQLPTVGQTSIGTTVSVPDGGTILLGGIKRLSEQRSEQGVPILSKIPYLNRLFTNVGTGRTASTLMMTVTPRIIIPEEEEERILGGSPLP